MIPSRNHLAIEAATRNRPSLREDRRGGVLQHVSRSMSKRHLAHTVREREWLRGLMPVEGATQAPAVAETTKRGE